MNQVLSSVHSSNNHTNAFPQNQEVIVFHSVQKCFVCPSHFITEYLKDLYELFLFCLFVLFTMTTNTIWCHCTDSCKRTGSFTHQRFYTISVLL